MERILFLPLAFALHSAAFGQADECVNASDLGVGASSAFFDTSVAVDTLLPATTSAESACGVSSDVWFKYTASMTGVATFSTCGAADFDTEIGVYEGADCSSLLALGCNDDAPSCAGFTSELRVPVTAGGVYHVNIGYFSATGGVTGSGSLTISEASPAINDTCASPTSILEGATPFDATAATTSGFSGGGSCALGASSLFQDLFFTFTATTTGAYSIDLFGSDYDTKLSVHDGVDCLAACSLYSDDVMGLQSAVTIDMVAGAKVLIQVGSFVDGGATPDGILNVTPVDALCDSADALEPSSSCETAAPMPGGTFLNLNVSDAQKDYYAVTVAEAGTLSVSTAFDVTGADLDLYLWDPMVACDTNVAGTGGAFLMQGTPTNGGETLSYFNGNEFAQCLILEVSVAASGGCNRYNLVVSGVGDGVGTPYCLATPNSSGAAAKLTGSGSAEIARNNLVLHTTQLPVNAFGFVIVSKTRFFVPMIGGGMGNLCIAGEIGRGVGGQISSSGPNGELTTNVDWQSVPRPTGSVAAVPGETWFFQTWTRDAVGGSVTNNLSNGLSVLVE